MIARPDATSTNDVVNEPRRVIAPQVRRALLRITRPYDPWRWRPTTRAGWCGPPGRDPRPWAEARTGARDHRLATSSTVDRRRRVEVRWSVGRRRGTAWWSHRCLARLAGDRPAADGRRGSRRRCTELSRAEPLVRCPSTWGTSRPLRPTTGRLRARRPWATYAMPGRRRAALAVGTCRAGSTRRPWPRRSCTVTARSSPRRRPRRRRPGRRGSPRVADGRRGPEVVTPATAGGGTACGSA